MGKTGYSARPGVLLREHLTISDRSDGGPGVLRAAEAEVLPALPIHTQVSHAWLMTGTQAPASWQLRATFPLGT